MSCVGISHIPDMNQRTQRNLNNAISAVRTSARGLFHWTEMIYTIFQCIDDDNVAEFVQRCTEGLENRGQSSGNFNSWGKRVVEELRDLIALGPRLYDEWNEKIGGVPWVLQVIREPGSSDEEFSEKCRRAYSDFLKEVDQGVEAFQKFFGSQLENQDSLPDMPPH